ncbi:MAG: hypothetical protein KKH72_09830 [Alphaproteobacteria bacterium]|nr:hypothetical protein [Alphaproteobacteria bacterium]
MKHFLLAAISALILAVGAPTAAFAQTIDPATDTVTQDQVITACSADDNATECIALTQRLVAKIKVTGGDAAAQRQLLNTLVVALAQTDGPVAQLAAAIDTIATDAPELVNTDAVAGIADGLVTGDTDTVTASINQLASPN